jgi:simple sugar transport system ATP-binding protein
MSDIRRIADRIVSMRDGEISGVFEGDQLDYEGAVNAMLGHRMTDVDINIGTRGKKVLANQLDQAIALRQPPFDFDLSENEVVAITGLLGSGKTALARCLFGLKSPAGGSIQIDGRGLRPSQAQGRHRQRRLHVAQGPRQQRGNRRFRHHPQHHLAVHGPLF